MPKVTGKTLKFWQNSVEQAIIDHNYDNNFNMDDSTDSSTTSPGKESTPGRAKRTLSITTFLREPLGAEIITGTLTLGVKYIVTATATFFDGLWAVGEIFTSDGTETCSGTEKVKPLGAIVTGRTMGLTIGGSTFKLTNIEYDLAYEEIPGTDTSTEANSTEVASGRYKATIKMDALMYRETAEQLNNAAPTAVAIIITYKTGLTLTCSAIIHQESITGDVSGQCKVTLNAEIQGTVTEVALGYITLATEQSFALIWEGGSSTDKSITGNIMQLKKNISADVNGNIKIKYDGVICGAITPAVYS